MAAPKPTLPKAKQRQILREATIDELIDRVEKLENQLALSHEAVNIENFRLYESILDTLPVGISVFDRDYQYQYANKKYHDLLGFGSENLIGMQLRDAVSDVTYALAKSGMDPVLDGTPVSFPNKLITDGQEIHIRVDCVPNFGEDGSVIGVIALIHDVSVQKHLQIALDGSEDRFHALVETIPHGISETDTSGTILFANSAHHKQLGYSGDELLGRNISDMATSPEAGAELIQFLKAQTEGQQTPPPIYGQRTKKNGDLIDVQVIWTPKRNETGDVIGYVSVVSDVTEQNKNNRAQKEIADRLELCLKSADIGTFSWNIIDGSHFWDDRMHDIWGLPHGTYSGKMESDFLNNLHPDDRKMVEQAVTNSLEEDAPYDIEYRINRPDGRVVYVEALASVERNQQGRPVKLSGVCLDISERKSVEGMKNQFVSTVSHELRTPLTSMRGALGLISGGTIGKADDNAMELILLAEKNAVFLSTLVNDILDFERADSGKLEFNFERFEFVSFLREQISALQGLAGELGTEFEFSTELTRIEIEGDNNRLAQVLANLLSNAAKYSP